MKAKTRRPSHAPVSYTHLDVYKRQQQETVMALKIIASSCTGCSACEPECPNVAIREKGGTFLIDPKKCTECEGQYDSPQCVAVCPVDGCIVKV